MPIIKGKNFLIENSYIELFDFRATILEKNQSWKWTPQRGYPLSVTEPKPAFKDLEKAINELLDEFQFSEIGNLIISDSLSIRLILEKPELLFLFEKSSEYEKTIEHPIEEKSKLTIPIIEVKGIKISNHLWKLLITNANWIGGDCYITDKQGNSLL